MEIWVVDKYIEKKCSDNNFTFKFAILDKKSAKIFFIIVIKLLKGYEKIIWNRMFKRYILTRSITNCAKFIVV